jgi:alpha-galactosidase
LRHCQQRLEKSEVSNPTDSPVLAGVRSHEYGSHIIEAMVTNHPTRIHGNVPNRGLISNLPEGCCVEVACLVDARGVQPTAVGALPSQLAALNRTNINFQELLTQAALYGDREALIHAVMLDPLASAVCTLDQIRAMVNEMLTAQAQWLPQFQA